MSPHPPVSSFASWVQFQARTNPHALAVTAGNRNVNYRGFAEHIERVTRRLAAKSIEAGARVSVTVDDEYLHWLVVMALSRIGAVSVSVSRGVDAHGFVKAAFIVTDGARIKGPKNVAIDAGWYTQAADDLPAFEEAPHDWDAPCRIVLSSGTTGAARKILLTYGDLRLRFISTGRTYGLNATARILTTMGVGSIGGFITPARTWAGGGCVILSAGPEENFTRLFLRNHPNVILASTVQLATLVKALPADYWPIEQAIVYVSGSALPVSVNRRTRARLSQALFVVYGSTEAGTVATAHAAGAEGKPGFTGFVLPTAQLQVVDDARKPVPAGTPGEIRVSAEGGATRYLDDDAASAETFRDGWFYPGDLGMLDGEGQLFVFGRKSEVINFGGVKLSPQLLEDTLANFPGVADIAVFAHEPKGGMSRPGIAVVAGKEFDEKGLKERFARMHKLPEPAILRVKDIPRNEMGKVLRNELAQAAAKLA
ncbi:MAG TPA: class I adenylate-forming enzyme family protein [Ramlibacter sp.]|nr:class I adenylate-forming enzyme family protein [Ramlibacter sp.]